MRSKHSRPVREVSVRVLEARFKRAVRPKVRLWAMIRLAEKLIGKEATQAKRALTLFAEAERLAESIDDRRGIAAAVRGIGGCQLHLSNFAEALETFKRALPIAEQTGYVEYEVLILLDIGHLYVGQSRHDLALQTLATCAELAELIENQHVQASATDQIGILLHNLGRYHDALEYYKKSLTLLDRTELVHERAMTLVHMSNSLRFLGKYEEAFSNLEQARQLSHTNGDNRTKGLCQISIGVIYVEIGDYPNALSSFLASAKTMERVGDRLSLAITYGNLMNTNMELGNMEQAAHFGEQALTVLTEIGYRRGEAAMYGNFGDYYLRQGQRTQAKRFQKRSLALSQEIGSKDYETTALIALAKMESDFGKFAVAEKLLQDALTVTSNDQFHTISVLLGLGELFKKQARPDRALPYLERAITIAEEIHSLSKEQEGHQLLAEVLEMKRDFELALQHWKLASSIKEKILGAEKQKAIAEIRIRSSIEKAESEKAALRKETKSKSQEIERMAMELAQKTEIIRTTSRQMREIVKPLPIKDSATRLKLDGALSNLERSIGGKRTIPNEFQLVHRDFLRKLSKKYPALTSAERKACVLVRDGLSTKQIADMMKVSTRSIDTHRYGIRRKMKLGRKTNLATLLAGM